MDPITIASLILTQTGLGGWLKDKLGGAVGTTTADKIVAVAQAATGVTMTSDSVPALSPEQVQAIKDKLVDNEQEIIRLQFADVADARATYRAGDHTMADKIAATIMSWNLWAVVGLIVANCLIVYFIKDPSIALAAGNLIGGSIMNLWQERQTAVGFYLGSSIGSKLKDRP